MIAPMILTRALLPALRRARGLVLIANLTATLSPDAAGRSAYVASKSGVRGFAEILRQDIEKWRPIVKASGFTAED